MTVAINEPLQAESPDTLSCGTLRYSRAGLRWIFFWLLWGDVAFILMESVVPSILPLQLHKLGAAEGDKYLYKPVACALFPLSKDDQDRWYVRQKGYKTEGWNLFCIDPNASPMPASESLKEELGLAEKIQREQKMEGKKKK